MEKLYKKIPSSSCINGCYKCCTNIIQYTPNELKAMGGYEYNEKCSHLKDGKCSIYDKRPFVCRIYGASEILNARIVYLKDFLVKKKQ